MVPVYSSPLFWGNEYRMLSHSLPLFPPNCDLSVPSTSFCYTFFVDCLELVNSNYILKKIEANLIKKKWESEFQFAIILSFLLNIKKWYLKFSSTGTLTVCFKEQFPKVPFIELGTHKVSNIIRHLYVFSFTDNVWHLDLILLTYKFLGSMLNWFNASY